MILSQSDCKLTDLQATTAKSECKHINQQQQNFNTLSSTLWSPYTGMTSCLVECNMYQASICTGTKIVTKCVS